MSGQDRASALLRKDRFNAEFEKANTHLYLTRQRIQHPNAKPQHLEHFLDAAVSLATLCQAPEAEHHTLDVLMWCYKQCEHEKQRCCHSWSFSSACDKQLAQLKTQICRACPHNVYPLLS